MLNTLKAYFSDTGGATAIEYALLVAVLSLGIIGAVSAVGQSTADTFQEVADLDLIP
jgi:pilus assembly protein Flp/PilA